MRRHAFYLSAGVWQNGQVIEFDPSSDTVSLTTPSTTFPRVPASDLEPTFPLCAALLAHQSFLSTPPDVSYPLSLADLERIHSLILERTIASDDATIPMNEIPMSLRDLVADDAMPQGDDILSFVGISTVGRFACGTLCTHGTAYCALPIQPRSLATFRRRQLRTPPEVAHFLNDHSHFSLDANPRAAVADTQVTVDAATEDALAQAALGAALQPPSDLETAKSGDSSLIDAFLRSTTTRLSFSPTLPQQAVHNVVFGRSPRLLTPQGLNESPVVRSHSASSPTLAYDSAVPAEFFGRAKRFCLGLYRRYPILDRSVSVITAWLDDVFGTFSHTIASDAVLHRFPPPRAYQLLMAVTHSRLALLTPPHPATPARLSSVDPTTATSTPPRVGILADVRNKAPTVDGKQICMRFLSTKGCNAGHSAPPVVGAHAAEFTPFQRSSHQRYSPI
ncbi:Aste57867_11291 [Aphanomyces stellatus]|uniref:Aste57867_11291 protein n=1 Tax=Aphanomyces stellatus TaxID=120398 RepID=A0A485KSK2_9STRA|nr:hypothetical protein As57867_011249 [Aphanomyces stellatus]VFT88153.1 Aste57867_11291 [Aphanomyces stellatus]